MLSLQLENGRVSLCCGKQKLMDNITVSVNRRDYGFIALAPDSIQDGVARFVQPGMKTPIEAFLGLKEGENADVLTFRCALVHQHVKAPYCFEGKDSFVIRFDFLTAQGLMANYESSDWWTRPAFAGTTGEMPDRTISALLNTGDGYRYFYPLCDDRYATCLRGEGESTALVGAIHCLGYDKVDGAVMAVGVGDDPYALVHETVKAGLSAVKQPVPLKDGRKEIHELNLLGWCTYDAFYREVTHDKIIRKLEEFKEKNVPVGMLLIDSGWFIHDGDGTKGQRAADLRANPEKFPKGLKGLVREVKEKYGVRYVGIWHGFPAIWQGIAKGSFAYEQTKDWLVELPSGFCFPGFTREKAFGFFNYWHSYLKNEGIDFIKVDLQGMAKLVAENVTDINDAMKNFHAGFEASAALHFDGKVINCMGMNQVNVQSRPLTGWSRNSDDFYPNRENGFGEHFLQNAYNAVYHGQIYHCDFDMWWTDHESARENAILRAISGGPVYVSDKLGQTRGEELTPFCSRHGRLYRCEDNGVVCRDNLFRDPTKEPVLAKMFNRSGASGLVAAFHVSGKDEPVCGAVKAADAEGLEGDRFLCYLHEAKRYYVVGRDEEIPVTLARHEAELAVFTPIYDGTAVLGLKEKYVSPETVVYDDVNSFYVLEGGTLAFYSEEEAPQVLVDGEKTALKQVEPHVFEVIVPDGEPVWVTIE